MGKSKLYLIGTHHFDLHGKKRLDYILEKIAPSIIAIEMNKDREENLEVNNEEIINVYKDTFLRSNLKLTEKQIGVFLTSSLICLKEIGYEIKSPKKYVRKNPNSRLEYVDIIGLNGKNMFGEFMDGVLSAINTVAEHPEIANLFLQKINKGVGCYLSEFQCEIDNSYQKGNDLEKEVNTLKKLMQNPEKFKKATAGMSQERIDFLTTCFNPARDLSIAEKIRTLYGSGEKKVMGIMGVGHLYTIEEYLKDLKPKLLTLDRYREV